MKGEWTAGRHTFDDDLNCCWCVTNWYRHQREAADCPGNKPPPPTGSRRIRTHIPDLAPGLPDRLREARARAQMSQIQLAFFVPCPAHVVAEYERGAKTPSLERLRELALALAVEETWLRLGIR